VYWFYSDLDAANKWTPSHSLSLISWISKIKTFEELKKFSKSSFDRTNIVTTASELKYTREIKRIFAEQLLDPSDEFIKFFRRKFTPGR